MDFRSDVVCEFTCRSQEAHGNSGKEEQRDADYKEKIRKLVNLILCIGYISAYSRIYSYRRNISVTFSCVNKQKFRRCTTDAARSPRSIWIMYSWYCIVQTHTGSPCYIRHGNGFVAWNTRSYFEETFIENHCGSYLESPQ